MLKGARQYVYCGIDHFPLCTYDTGGWFDSLILHGIDFISLEPTCVGTSGGRRNWKPTKLTYQTALVPNSLNTCPRASLVLRTQRDSRAKVWFTGSSPNNTSTFPSLFLNPIFSPILAFHRTFTPSQFHYITPISSPSSLLLHTHS
jgi:hypothetical protein